MGALSVTHSTPDWHWDSPGPLGLCGRCLSGAPQCGGLQQDLWGAVCGLPDVEASRAQGCALCAVQGLSRRLPDTMLEQQQWVEETTVPLHSIGLLSLLSSLTDRCSAQLLADTFAPATNPHYQLARSSQPQTARSTRCAGARDLCAS